MTNHKRITKPELWKQIHDMEQKLCFMERFLEEKGLFAEAKEYVAECDPRLGRIAIQLSCKILFSERES